MSMAESVNFVIIFVQRSADGNGELENILSRPIV